jgi:SAM-dependent methyltransferase
MAFADHFSRSAKSYAAFRPHYPPALFSWLASVAPDHDRAWDCATGNGQAAADLAPYFALVLGTDPSIAQLANATGAPNVSYVVMTGERPALADRSVSLVTVAQALHWLNRPEFFDAARRVLIPGGIIAVWSYALAAFDVPEIDTAMRRFYTDTVGPYWPPERAIIDAGYDRLEFPFDELSAPPMTMEAQWSLDHLAGYVSTWSAVWRARTATGRDPLPTFLASISSAWGSPHAVRRIHWPLAIRAGRVS